MDRTMSQKTHGGVEHTPATENGQMGKEKLALAVMAVGEHMVGRSWGCVWGALECFGECVREYTFLFPTNLGLKKNSKGSNPI